MISKEEHEQICKLYKLDQRKAESARRDILRKAKTIRDIAEAHNSNNFEVTCKRAKKKSSSYKKEES